MISTSMKRLPASRMARFKTIGYRLFGLGLSDGKKVTSTSLGLQGFHNACGLAARTKDVC